MALSKIKLLEMSQHFIRKDNGFNDEGFIDKICKTFGVPERRVPKVDEMKEYVSKNCKYGCYECGGCGYDDQIIEACHALFARTEEKK